MFKLNFIINKDLKHFQNRESENGFIIRVARIARWLATPGFGSGFPPDHPRFNTAYEDGILPDLPFP
jgi:hypothetical protein